MLRLPVILPPKLTKSQVNTDRNKKTLFNVKTSYTSDTLASLSKLVRKKEIDILNLGEPSKYLNINEFYFCLNLNKHNTLLRYSSVIKWIVFR